jgi:hypothetical protein
MRAVKEFIGMRIASFINAPIKGYEPLVSGLDHVDLRPADVILVRFIFQILEKISLIMLTEAPT